jgi:hypothetical protein
MNSRPPPKLAVAATRARPFDRRRLSPVGRTPGAQVEELIELPDLRTDVGRVRDRAQAARAEFTRHGQEPQWDLVQLEMVGPLAEVRQRLSQELARRQSADALVPIDRDPVPRRYAELVRRYYERLGQDE